MSEKDTMPSAAEVSEAAKLKAELAAFREARTKALEPARKASEVERLKRELANAKAIAAAEDEHGPENIRPVHTESGVVIVKRDDHLQFKRFMDRADFSAKRLEEQIARCLVYPDGDTLDRWLAREPARLQTIAGAISVLAGSKDEEIAGK